MNFIDRVKKYEYKLNDTDDLIIEFLTEHQSEINSISIKDIASKLYVAPNTIMRLAKKLEYSGFSELKALLNVREMKSNSTSIIELLINYRDWENNIVF